MATAEVSAILAHCNERQLAVVPQGGNTGLVGGGVPVHDEIVISLSRMNRIVHFDSLGGVLQCQAGCVLGNLDEWLMNQDFMMPLDLAASGTAQIGGNVSTNAGGVRFIRYGSLKGSVLGLEVVLADGRILDNMTLLPKDNSGYHLSQLFIGSEGTLGLITGVSIQTPRLPASRNVALLACSSYSAVTDLYHRARAGLGEILSAVEFMDEACMGLVLRHYPSFQCPFRSSSILSPFYLLVETTGSHDIHDKEKLEGFLVAAYEDSLASDAVLAQDEAQLRSLWALRELQAVAQAEVSRDRGIEYLPYDMSLPLEDLYTIVDDLRVRLAGRAEVLGFGHLGDGNLHLSVLGPARAEEGGRELLPDVEPYIYEATAQLGGSISAEHGLGQMKNEEIRYSKTPMAVEVMRQIKACLDPKGILNPYKVLP